MENKSIFIRKVEFDDAEFILHWENNEENWAVSENSSPYSLFDIISLISELQDVRKAEQGRWMICSKESLFPIGCVDLTGIDFENKTAEVGILIADKEVRRLGFALKTLHLVEEQAKELGLDKLLCSIHSVNIASIELFKKCNYQQLDGKENGIYFFEKWLKK